MENNPFILMLAAVGAYRLFCDLTIRLPRRKTSEVKEYTTVVCWTASRSEIPEAQKFYRTSNN